MGNKKYSNIYVVENEMKSNAVFRISVRRIDDSFRRRLNVIDIFMRYVEGNLAFERKSRCLTNAFRPIKFNLEKIRGYV
uniref:Uncharacterized protein n=1 Tax=Romanomermis culicivorax TaxID=13658 RepID=A0A915JSY9_ROMCU